ncbi:hypothetical protein CgunFtcFv8_009743 [Champsocephalus gunnari]|uniref:Uncharacterized protein n=1 Tax=Champsocephalus gunnari TaxID=52237 RepID=A0AAN8H1P8_CHAGU|nr:hypothetical protein CgunFtcFv8_009743 [Champsocephalus gunnari]
MRRGFRLDFSRPISLSYTNTRRYDAAQHDVGPMMETPVWKSVASEELLDRSVFVSVCTEEMARPDWGQRAKHLDDTRQDSEHIEGRL